MHHFVDYLIESIAKHDIVNIPVSDKVTYNFVLHTVHLISVACLSLPHPHSERDRHIISANRPLLMLFSLFIVRSYNSKGNNDLNVEGSPATHHCAYVQKSVLFKD